MSTFSAPLVTSPPMSTMLASGLTVRTVIVIWVCGMVSPSCSTSPPGRQRYRVVALQVVGCASGARWAGAPTRALVSSGSNTRQLIAGRIELALQVDDGDPGPEPHVRLKG